MRILVISDCHGDKNSVIAAIESQSSAHTILFLGDGLRDIEFVQERFIDKTFYIVGGNCDWSNTEP